MGSSVESSEITFPISHTGAATDDVLTAKVTGDSTERFSLNADGKLEWGPGSGALDLSLQRGAGFLEMDTPSGGIRFGEQPDLIAGLTGIMFSSNGTDWVGFEHENNKHMNAHGTFRHIRTSTSSWSVGPGDATSGPTGTLLSTDTLNGIIFANGKLQFGSLSGSDTAMERAAAGVVGTVSGVDLLTNAADLFAQAQTGASAAKLGAVGPLDEAGVLFGEDAGWFRSAANTMKTLDSVVVDSGIQGNGVVVLTNTGTSGYFEAREQAPDPAAPASNAGRFYFRDSGAGKTQFCVRFATGAVQVLAEEP